MRRLTLVLSVLVALAAAGCGGKTQGALVGKPAANKPCPDSLPFTAGYVPAGFQTKIQDGPAAGKTPLKNVTIFHYTGPGGRYIEILRGGKRAILNGAVGMLVLNRNASIGPLQGGSAINFRLGNARCARYQVYSNDPDPHAKELVKVGHGLRLLSGQ